MKKLLIFLAMPLLAITGCASVKMQETQLVIPSKANMAIVTFVRPSIFFGDGISIDVWDGEHFVGSLGAGKLIQHEVEPGKHLFLANAENWSYAAADLLPGKEYFIKANLFPGIMYGRVALGVAQNTDSRIPEWKLSLKPENASATDKAVVEGQKAKEIQSAISDFNSGKVTSFSKVLPEHGL